MIIPKTQYHFCALQAPEYTVSRVIKWAEKYNVSFLKALELMQLNNNVDHLEKELFDVLSQKRIERFPTPKARLKYINNLRIRIDVFKMYEKMYGTVYVIRNN